MRFVRSSDGTTLEAETGEENTGVTGAEAATSSTSGAKRRLVIHGREGSPLMCMRQNEPPIPAGVFPATSHEFDPSVVMESTLSEPRTCEPPTLIVRSVLSVTLLSIDGHGIKWHDQV